MKQHIITALHRHAPAVLLMLAGLILWVIGGLTLEPFQAGIGPEVFLRLPVKLVSLGFAYILTRLIIRHLFPTIFRFTDTEGGGKQSHFSQSWQLTPADPRLWISALVWAAAFLSVSQILL